MSQEEQELIRSILAGSSEAFEQLIAPYGDRLFNTLSHILRSAEAAEDVLQDALVQAFVKLNTYQGKSSFYTWLYRIAVNLAFSYRRRERPMISMDSQKSELGDEPVSTMDAVDAKVAALNEQSYYTQPSATSREFRAVVILREIEGCDYKLLEAYYKSTGNRPQPLHRGRMQLREKLLLCSKIHQPHEGNERRTISVFRHELSPQEREDVERAQLRTQHCDN